MDLEHLLAHYVYEKEAIKVLVIEKGKWFKSEDFTKTKWNYCTLLVKFLLTLFRKFIFSIFNELLIENRYANRRFYIS